MNDGDAEKTRDELAREVARLRARVAELEQAQAESRRVEAALRASEARLLAVVEDQTELIVRYDADWTLTFVNEACCRFTGKTREELVGRSFIPFIDQKDRGLVKAKISSLSASNPVATHEQRVILPNGEVRWQQWTNRVIYDDDGQLVGYQGVGRDITDRKHTEQALRASEARYRAVVDDQTELVCRFLADGTLTFVNEACCRAFGKPRSELIGQNLLSYIYPADQQSLLEVIDSRSLDNLVGSHEGRYLLPSGDVRWRHWTTRAIYDDQDQLIEFQGVGSDITERKRTEQALRDSEERLRQLFDEAPVGYHELDSQGRITQVNSTECHMLGYTAEEMLGRNVWEFIVESEASRRSFQAKMAGKMPAGRGFERTYQRKDGSTLPVLIEDHPILDPMGRVVGMRSTIEDIAELKRAQEEREKLIQKLQDALVRIKTLRGLIPICARCKKIRDDEGYWHQLEAYVGSHSEAEFSHGICPECAKELYPDLVDDEDDDD